jgi:hypothetical protein
VWNGFVVQHIDIRGGLHTGGMVSYDRVGDWAATTRRTARLSAPRPHLQIGAVYGRRITRLSLIRGATRRTCRTARLSAPGAKLARSSMSGQ